MMDWLNRSFPWIGLAGAIVLLVLMFGTNKLQADPAVSRWRDLTWLSWAGAAAYLIHNVEEYGIDLFGRTYAFPLSVCRMFGFRDTLHCPAPPAFFTAVNVPMFWFAAPAAALLSKRHPLVGLTIYSVMSVNLVAHVVGGVAAGTIYNPGWLTAVLLFLPLSAWTAHALSRRGRLNHGALVYLLGWGVALHLVLAGSLVPLMKGLVQTPVPAIVIQVINAALLIVAPWFAERWRGGILLHPGHDPRRDFRRWRCNPSYITMALRKRGRSLAMWKRLSSRTDDPKGETG